MELYASVIKSKKQPIGIVTGGGSNQMVAVEKKPTIDERPPATPTQTTEDLLTRIAIVLEGVAASQLRAVLSNDP